MDVNGSLSEFNTNNNNDNSNVLHLISTIKDSLVDISVELADIKKNIRKTSERTVPNCSVSSESKENFLRFDEEIQQNTEKFDEFKNILSKIFTNNENEIKSNLPKYYFIVLRSCFKRNLMNHLSWNKYNDKLAVSSTRIFQAIQHSGSVVDSLSTEFDRKNILHKEFRKFKDSCRARKGKLKKGDLISANIHFSFWCLFQLNQMRMRMQLKNEMNKKTLVCPISTPVKSQMRIEIQVMVILHRFCSV